MEVITRATDASFFMKYLLRELKLPSQCTHIQFVEAFSGLQAESKKYELEMRSAYEEGIKNGTIKVVENGKEEV